MAVAVVAAVATAIAVWAAVESDQNAQLIQMVQVLLNKHSKYWSAY